MYGESINRGTEEIIEGTASIDSLPFE